MYDVLQVDHEEFQDYVAENLPFHNSTDYNNNNNGEHK